PPRRDTREPEEDHHAPPVRDVVQRDRRRRPDGRETGQEAPRACGQARQISPGQDGYADHPCPVRRVVPRHRPDRSRRPPPGGAPMTDQAARPHGRLARVRDALTPAEWARAGAMAATIIGLHVAGWGMLAAAAGGHYHITGTQLFGV